MALAVHGALLLPVLLDGSYMAAPVAPMQLALLIREKPPTPERQAAASAARSAEPLTSPPVEQPAAPTSQAPAPRPSSTASQNPAASGQVADGATNPAGAAGPPSFDLACLGNQKRLTADKRRKCDDKQWTAIGRHDPSDSGQVPAPLIDPNKAAYYDAVVAARNSPGHGPGFGCGMPITLGEGGSKLARELKRQRLAKENNPHAPPHSLKFGPLPCYLTPPQGFMTPEADVPPLDTFTNGHAPSPPDYIQPIYRDPFARPGPGG